MNQLKAHIALFSANFIYGLNYVIAKDVMPDFMAPRAIIFLRVLVAMVVFNIIHALFVKEKIERKDLLRLMACGLFGTTINQILFFEGLNLTTPINASLIVTACPIMVLLFSYFILKETINTTKIIGIFLGTGGAGMLILLGGSLLLTSSTFIGNLLIFIDILSYGLYLVIAKSIMKKYHPLTAMKWIFTFGFIFIFPFCIQKVLNTNFEIIPLNIWFSVIYIVFGVTILAYFLNIYALKFVSPVVNSYYMYTQPFIAALISIIYLHEQLTPLKIATGIMIFTGVYFVSVRKTRVKK